MKDPITTLLAELQSQSIAFNGYGISPHPARWIGTEMGNAPDPNWSTGITNDGGDPDSPIFCPAECDTTLQSNDRWFWVCFEHAHRESSSISPSRVLMSHFVHSRN